MATYLEKHTKLRAKYTPQALVGQAMQHATIPPTCMCFAVFAKGLEFTPAGQEHDWALDITDDDDAYFIYCHDLGHMATLLTHNIQPKLTAWPTWIFWWSGVDQQWQPLNQAFNLADEHMQTLGELWELAAAVAEFEGDAQTVAEVLLDPPINFVKRLEGSPANCSYALVYPGTYPPGLKLPPDAVHKLTGEQGIMALILYAVSYDHAHTLYHSVRSPAGAKIAPLATFCKNYYGDWIPTGLLPEAPANAYGPSPAVVAAEPPAKIITLDPDGEWQTYQKRLAAQWSAGRCRDFLKPGFQLSDGWALVYAKEVDLLKINADFHDVGELRVYYATSHQQAHDIYFSAKSVFYPHPVPLYVFRAFANSNLALADTWQLVEDPVMQFWKSEAFPDGIHADSLRAWLKRPSSFTTHSEQWAGFRCVVCPTGTRVVLGADMPPDMVQKYQPIVKPHRGWTYVYCHTAEEANLTIVYLREADNATLALPLGYFRWVMESDTDGHWEALMADTVPSAFVASAEPDDPYLKVLASPKLMTYASEGQYALLLDWDTGTTQGHDSSVTATLIAGLAPVDMSVWVGRFPIQGEEHQLSIFYTKVKHAAYLFLENFKKAAPQLVDALRIYQHGPDLRWQRLDRLVMFNTVDPVKLAQRLRPPVEARIQRPYEVFCLSQAESGAIYYSLADARMAQAAHPAPMIFHWHGTYWESITDLPVPARRKLLRLELDFDDDAAA